MSNDQEPEEDRAGASPGGVEGSGGESLPRFDPVLMVSADARYSGRVTILVGVGAALLGALFGVLVSTYLSFRDDIDKVWDEFYSFRQSSEAATADRLQQQKRTLRHLSFNFFVTMCVTSGNLLDPEQSLCAFPATGGSLPWIDPFPDEPWLGDPREFSLGTVRPSTFQEICSSLGGEFVSADPACCLATRREDTKELRMVKWYPHGLIKEVDDSKDCASGRTKP